MGNWLMRVGKIKKVAHVYKNPWSPLWIAEIKADDWTETFTSAMEAKLCAELRFRDYLDDLLHCEHDIMFFESLNFDIG